ncbi:Uncharacterised protein g2044 [Pycnogonum litorale]
MNLSSVYVKDLETPAFLIDYSKLLANCEKVLKGCTTHGLKLRSHVKTHKCTEIGEIQTGGSKRCIDVSTLQEAEYFADAGFDDILYAVVLSSNNKIKRCRNLCDRLETFHVMIDSFVGLRNLEGNHLSNGKKWSIYLAVNAGTNREGVVWDSIEAVDLGKAVFSSPYCSLTGLYVYCGSAYDAGTKNGVIEETRNSVGKIKTFVEKLKSVHGIQCPAVGLGSTPACSSALQAMTSLDEIYSGAYVFYDMENVVLGSCTENEIAVRVATTVLGHYPENQQLLVDCGQTGISKEGMGILATGYGKIQRHPDLNIVELSQEVAKVVSIRGKMDYEKYPIGSMLYILPFHASITAYCHSVYYVHDKENEIIAKWYPTKGWQ